jgi:2',3'-cyclic-nucleotide 2'-phosphodiesterase (5'-nucleotidase family)
MLPTTTTIIIMTFVCWRSENHSKPGRTSSWTAWKSIVAGCITVLVALEPSSMITAVSAVSAVSLHTTSNVLRESPPSNNNNNNKAAANDDLYHKNTYDPWSMDDEETKISLSKEIPWGSINILVVTDVHSWITGNHRDDPRHWPYDGHRQKFRDADYGDVLSFYRRLQDIVEDHNNQNENNKRDIFFVMNGDSVDGTGLSEFPPTHLEPLLQHMPWDAMNVGNHELYHDETVKFLMEQQQREQPLGEWKRGNYLSSNTVLVDTNNQNQQPMVGNKYAYLEGKHTNTTILTFGFLYDFHEGSHSVTNVAVEDAVQEPWFSTVLGEDAPRAFDAILVLAHMDCLDPLVKVILEGIRAALPSHKKYSVPIQFVNGHTHRRCHAKLDATAESFEAGRFLDTIGFVSFDGNTVDDVDNVKDKNGMDDNNIHGNNSDDNANANNFQHRFLDANRKSLHETLVLARPGDDQKDYTFDFKKDFGTPDGRALTEAIRKTQADMGLNKLLGCSPKTYGIFESDDNRPSKSNQVATATPLPLSLNKKQESLWYVYLEKMLPDLLLAPMHRSNPTSGEPILVSGTGVLRYSLFEGPVTVNDVIAISPFDDTIHELESSSEASSGDEQQNLPIYGWQLMGLMEASNRLYAHHGEYGMPTFVLSTLPVTAPAPGTAEAADTPIDPGRVYRLFATDYDATRLLSVLAVLKQQDEEKSTTKDNIHLGEEPPSSSSTEIPSITKGRSFHSHLACRGKNKYESNTLEDCYSLTELWKQYILEQMPCSDSESHPNNNSNNNRHSLRWGVGGRNDDSLDASPLLSSQILQPPLSATSARVHSRMTPVQEENILANDQKAAMALVVATLAVIAYMLVNPPEQNDNGRSVNVGRRKHKNPPIVRNPRDTPLNHTTRRDNEADGGVDVQLIPLCRYNTGNLSEGSYGSI